MSLKNKVLIILSFILLLVCLTACGNDSSKLVGVWKLDSKTGDYDSDDWGDFMESICIYDDGTAIIDGASCEWKLADGEIMFADENHLLAENNYYFNAKYSVSGKKLTIKDADESYRGTPRQVHWKGEMIYKKD